MTDRKTEVEHLLGRDLSKKELSDLVLKLGRQAQPKPKPARDLRDYQMSLMLGRDADTANKTPETNGAAVTQILDARSPEEFKLLLNPSSGLTHYYVVLDSDYRDTTDEITSSIKKFSWRYAPTQNLKTGFCNSVGVVSNIVGMRMYQPRVPYVSGMNNTAKRVSVLVEEFSAQSFICENGRRFHFLLRPIFPASTSIELSTEDYNDGLFSFRDAFTTLSSLTVSFGDPTDVLAFATPFDRFIIAFEFVCKRVT
jgi:hypothetical protein